MPATPSKNSLLETCAELFTAIGSKVAALRRSENARGSLRNAGYSIADCFLRPILMLPAAPFLVHRLGLDSFGIWMLANGIAASHTVFNIGLGDATMKFVSQYRGTKDVHAVVRFARAAFSLSAVLGTALAIVVWSLAPLLGRSVFKIPPHLQPVAIRGIQIGGIVLGLRAVEAVLISCLRGYEQYGRSGRVTMFSKIVALASAVVFAAIGYGVVPILSATAASTLLSIYGHARAAKAVEPMLSFRVVVDREAWRQMAHFGVFTWLQSTSAFVFDQLDRLLIAMFLGSSALGYYALCLQLAQPVHTFAAAAFNFVFPLMSKYPAAGAAELRSRFHRFVLANVTMAALLAVPLAVLGKFILRVWMGPAFAAEASVPLALLAVAYGLLAINVVPHYTLLGLGRVRFVSTLNIACGVAVLVAMFMLVPVLHLTGAALCRLLYAGVLALPYFIVAARSVAFVSRGEQRMWQWAYRPE